MRSSYEIKEIFENKGCAVKILCRGTSYRAGGDVVIFSPELAEVSIDDLDNFDDLEIITLPEKAFDGTGYDGRGREYGITVIKTGGEFQKATQGQYLAVDEKDRIKIGADNKSGWGEWYFIRKGSDNLSDLSGIFDALGL